MSFVKLDRLEQLPKLRDMHHWADHAELLCLLSKDQVLSQGDFGRRIREGRITGEGNPADDDYDEAQIVDYDPESENETKTMPGMVSNRDERLVEDIFEHLVFRSRVFAGSYPFELTENSRTIIVKAQLNYWQKLYVMLLLGSNLHLIKSKAHAGDIADVFEVVGETATRAQLPSSASIFVFGSNIYAREQRYTGLLVDKIEKLASDLNNRLSVQYDRKNFKKKDTGDGGLDIVAWIPMGDAAGYELIIFGQCGCTDEWPRKQFESMAERWRSRIDFFTAPINAIYIPYCFREASGVMFNDDKIVNSVLWDRSRLLSHELEMPERASKKMIEIVDAALSERLDIV